MRTPGPAPDWLARQLAHVGAGARAVAGLIELDPDESRRLAPEVRRRRERDAAQRLERVREHRSRRRPPSLRRRVARRHRRRLPRGRRHRAGRRRSRTPRSPSDWPGRDPCSARRRRPRADLRARRRPRGTGAVGRPRRVLLGRPTTVRRRAQFPPARLHRNKGATSVAVVIPTKECADTIGGVLARTVGPAARRRGWSTRCWSSTPARRTGPPRSGARPGPR